MKRDLDSYMRLFFIIDKLFARHDPCKNCTGCDAILFKEPVPYDCCDGCPFNSPKGCTTYSIACKIWLCTSSLRKRKSKRFMHQRERLKKIALAMNFYYARAMPLEVLLLQERKDTWFFYNTFNRR